ncbi:MAG: nucleoside recognition domain-containing protein [Verrucomicrobiota bacterium]
MLRKDRFAVSEQAGEAVGIESPPGNASSTGNPIEPDSIGAWERFLRYPLVSLALLFAPSWIAVTQANALADRLYEPLGSALARLLEWLSALPTPWAEMLSGDYGVVAMLPFLLLYALPTIVFFSLLIAIYQSTGLMDIMAQSLHPYLRPFGLGAQELTRVMMGFGCNVPAVVSSRA